MLTAINSKSTVSVTVLRSLLFCRLRAVYTFSLPNASVLKTMNTSVEDCEHTEAEVAQLIEPEPTPKSFHLRVKIVNVFTQEKTNPFIHRTAKMTVYEWIKIVLIAPIATIRLP